MQGLSSLSITSTSPPLSSRANAFAATCVLDSAPREQQHRRAAAMTYSFNHSLLSRGYDTVRAANRGNARSQAELGKFHYASAKTLDILQGAPADDQVVEARWAEALTLLEMAAEQGAVSARVLSDQIYAAGDRSVPQNWATAAKWWRKAAEAGDKLGQRYMGQCYYYGRGGVDQDAAQAMVWFRKAAAQGNLPAVQAVQLGIPGQGGVRELIVRFTNADSAPPRHAAAHEFAGMVYEDDIEDELEKCNVILQEFDSVVPHQSPRDSVWVEFMLATSLSDEDLELAKRVYAYSQRTCTFCGSNSAPLRNCSLCMELCYCVGTDCQHAHWNKTPAAESHKVMCPRIFVRGSKGRTRRAVAIESSSSSSSSE
jgi:TPR repeat protein